MGYEPEGELEMFGDHGRVKYGKDEHLVVFFYKKSVHNALKSQAAGVRFHDELDFVKMHAPGEHLQVIDRPVVESDKTRFPRQWRAFQQGRKQETDGIPIDMLFPLHPAVADNLRSYGVHTIEQCANMSASAIESIGMGAQDYKNRAVDYMEAASAGANYHKFTAQLDEEKRKNVRLQKQLDELSAQFTMIMNQVKAGMLVPGAMVPQQGIPGLANFQPVQPQNALPIRGEAEPAAQPRRNDLMADLPKGGRIKRSWGKNAQAAEGADE
jgi:hypothetical protein